MYWTQTENFKSKQINHETLCQSNLEMNYLFLFSGNLSLKSCYRNLKFRMQKTKTKKCSHSSAKAIIVRMWSKWSISPPTELSFNAWSAVVNKKEIYLNNFRFLLFLKIIHSGEFPEHYIWWVFLRSVGNKKVILIIKQINKSIKSLNVLTDEFSFFHYKDRIECTIYLAQEEYTSTVIIF